MSNPTETPGVLAPGTEEELATFEAQAKLGLALQLRYLLQGVTSEDVQPAMSLIDDVIKRGGFDEKLTDDSDSNLKPLLQDIVSELPVEAPEHINIIIDLQHTVIPENGLYDEFKQILEQAGYEVDAVDIIDGRYQAINAKKTPLCNEDGYMALKREIDIHFDGGTGIYLKLNNDSPLQNTLKELPAEAPDRISLIIDLNHYSCPEESEIDEFTEMLDQLGYTVNNSDDAGKGQRFEVINASKKVTFNPVNYQQYKAMINRLLSDNIGIYLKIED